ncbi:MAG: cadmium-translocating P-type ATPase, partial [Desulfosarcina sp.]|nr:cadmium-translocating P-type ATPase [Desulfosarcina sp.]MBC2768295.1 cadmium-translocating P-type ATPase [Desulfosarcina sp.]
SALWHFVGMTLLVGMVFVREVILKRPLAQTLFSPLGMITSLAALPLVKKGFEKLKEGRLTLESFLGGSIIAAVAACEAAAALEILWVTSGGELLQNWITERSRRAIREILQVTEKETYILTGGVEVSIPVNQVQPGDTVVLHTGEKIAVDGEIIKGEAVIDDSPITGRAEPVTRAKRDKVFAGTFVRQGVIFVKAQEVGDRTYLARILRMVEDSLENKAPIEGVADRLAQNLIKAGFAVTLATLVLTRSAWRAFTVMLVMACPCATILAASTAISAAINAAARRHILIKGGRYLEEAGRANVICFDKTGTLTTNEPELKQLVNFNGLPEDELLQLAYATEIHNSHPVALAIKSEARKRGITPISHDVCEYFLGKGVRSEIHGEEILVGSHKLLVFIAKNRELLGVAGFANQDRADVVDVVRYLQNDGFNKTAMITGDSKYSALEMAKRLNFDECRYSVLPEEKTDIVAGLRTNGDRVLMVGDGINDAMALAEADIGIAMGAGGSEVAIEAADIALVKDDLKGVVYVRCLSRKTLKVVHQNFWIATGSNIAGVTLGALGLLSPVMAGMIHITHTLGILANSSRLLFYDPPPVLSNGIAQPSTKIDCTE